MRNPGSLEDGKGTASFFTFSLMSLRNVRRDRDELRTYSQYFGNTSKSKLAEKVDWGNDGTEWEDSAFLYSPLPSSHTSGNGVRPAPWETVGATMAGSRELGQGRG